MSVIVLGTSVLIGRHVLLGLGLGHRVRLASEFTASFPIPLVNILDKISEVVKASGFIEMNHFVLDSLRQSQIGSGLQSRIVVLKHGRESVEFNKKPSCLVIILHD
jgi:hypothetical protein